MQRSQQPRGVGLFQIGRFNSFSLWRFCPLYRVILHNAPLHSLCEDAGQHPVIVLHRVPVEPAAVLGVLCERLGEGKPSDPGNLFRRALAHVRAPVHVPHGIFPNACRFCNLAPLTVRQQFQQGRRCGIGAIFSHTLFL